MSFMSCIMRAMFTYGELVKVLESSGHTGTLYFLLVCLFAVLIIEKKLSNGENFEVCVNIYEIEVFGKRLSG